MLEHTDGVPTTGIEVGYTQDAATFTYKQNKQEVEAEQSLNPVDVFIVNEEIQIEFNAMEHVYSSLQDGVRQRRVSVDDDEKMMFYGGDGAGLVSVDTQCVALTSRIRTAPTKHEVLVLYRVYNMEGVSIPYNRTGVALYKITLKGLVDTTRDGGGSLVPVVPREGSGDARRAQRREPPARGRHRDRVCRRTTARWDRLRPTPRSRGPKASTWCWPTRRTSTGMARTGPWAKRLRKSSRPARRLAIRGRGCRQGPPLLRISRP